MSDTDAFFAGGGLVPAERVNGRYKLSDPVTGESKSWQTASNYGFPLQDQYGLNKWRLRQLLTGVAQRPDLLALLAAMVDYDKGKLDEIAETALQVAGTSADANIGTAVHEALRAADEGKPYPPMFEPHVRAYRAELARFGLRAVLVERLVITPALGAAGRLDRGYEEADGTLVLGDIKTSGRLDLSEHEISVQLAVYQGASHVRSLDDKTWEPLPRMRDDYAIVVHVDRESGAVSVYRVDLTIGKNGANLAAQIRGWRKAGPVLLPYVPPVTVGPELQAGRVAQYGERPVWTSGPTTAAEMQEAIHRPAPDYYSPFNGPTVTGPPEVPAPRAAPDESAPRVSDPDPWGTADGSRRVHEGRPQVFQLGEWMDLTGPETASLGQVIGQVTDEYKAAQAALLDGAKALGYQPGRKTAAELKKGTKAQVQEYCRQHGVTEDLAHTKDNLVIMLGKRGLLADGGKPGAITITDQTGVSGETLDPFGTRPSTPGTTGTTRTQPSDSPGGSSGPPPPTGNPDDPRDKAFTIKVMALIKVAESVGTLQTIRNNVVKQGGDQAWTDEMTEAARVRVSVLDAGTTAFPTSPTPLDRIGLCEQPQDLAQLWEQITIGGSATERWTAEIEAAAMAKMDQLTASRPAAPANPFVQPST